MMHDVYLIGSLRNEQVPIIAAQLREHGLTVFEEWYSAGPRADEHYYAYAKSRGWSYAQALQSHAARNIFNFDHKHILCSRVGVLVMPAGRSGHLELGVILGQGKPGFVLFDKEPERFDQMYQFCDGVFFDVETLAAAVKTSLAGEGEPRG